MLAGSYKPGNLLLIQPLSHASCRPCLVTLKRSSNRGFVVNSRGWRDWRLYMNEKTQEEREHRLLRHNDTGSSGINQLKLFIPMYTYAMYTYAFLKEGYYLT